MRKIMIERDAAIEIQIHTLSAIEALTRALNSAVGRCSEEDLWVIKRGIGLCLGDIQMEILEVINSQYPELDHLKDVHYELNSDK